MDITPIFNRQQWNKLPEGEAQAILHHLLKTQFPEFTLKQFKRFEKFNQSTYSAMLDYNGNDFVIVPGDTVTLGIETWDLAEDNKVNMLDFFEGDEAALQQYIQKNVSPVRTATLPPMIVECVAKETGYVPVSLQDPSLVEERDFEKYLKQLKEYPNEEYIISVYKIFRLEKNGEEIKAFLYKPASYDELVEQVLETGFRLPIEDEWEYLCGGGTRTLYPWGDNISWDQNYRHLIIGEGKDESYFLDIPNHFGLVIANDPYHNEIIMDSEYFLKGGDGGGNICGGAGLELGYLPISTYYRDANMFDEDMDYKGEITGEYCYVRRIKRITV